MTRTKMFCAFCKKYFCPSHLSYSCPPCSGQKWNWNKITKLLQKALFLHRTFFHTQIAALSLWAQIDRKIDVCYPFKIFDTWKVSFWFGLPAVKIGWYLNKDFPFKSCFKPLSGMVPISRPPPVKGGPGNFWWFSSESDLKQKFSTESDLKQKLPGPPLIDYF